MRVYDTDESVISEQQTEQNFVCSKLSTWIFIESPSCSISLRFCCTERQPRSKANTHTQAMYVNISKNEKYPHYVVLELLRSFERTSLKERMPLTRRQVDAYTRTHLGAYESTVRRYDAARCVRQNIVSRNQTYFSSRSLISASRSLTMSFSELCTY